MAAVATLPHAPAPAPEAPAPRPGMNVSFGDYSYRLSPRWGFGKPAHPRLQRIFAAGRERYLETLRLFAELKPALERIPLEDAGDGRTPHWKNDWFPPLDAIALYGMLCVHEPETFVEIGSGNSTRFARRAIADHGLKTKIISIDPEPRASIDHLSDEVVRMRLEDVDPEVFSGMSPNDLLFADNSHRSLQNSDVTAFFLDVLPQAPPGTLVHVHDICLPDDYPPEWLGRIYNEQYLLATALLYGESRLSVEFPSYFAFFDPELSAETRRLFGDGPLGALRLSGGSFWMRTR